MSGKNDIRLDEDFFEHYKVGRVHSRLGAAGVLGLIALFCSTAKLRPDGVLTGMSDREIAWAAKLPVERGEEFVQALAECGWLDRDEEAGCWAIHQWAEHQEYVVRREARSQQARENATRGWATRRDEGAGKKNAAALRITPDGNTPLLSTPKSPQPPVGGQITDEARRMLEAYGEYRHAAKLDRELEARRGLGDLPDVEELVAACRWESERRQPGSTRVSLYAWVRQGRWVDYRTWREGQDRGASGGGMMLADYGMDSE